MLLHLSTLTSSSSKVGIDQRHEILVDEKTLLNEITGCVRGAVNSSHHQCVETLGANLSVAARAEDPIIEAIQWKNAKENPFYLGVQVKRITAIRTFHSRSLSVASRAHGRPDKSILVQHSTSLSRRCRATQENGLDRYRRRRRRAQRLREQQRNRKRTARQQGDQTDRLSRRQSTRIFHGLRW